MQAAVAPTAFAIKLLLDEDFCGAAGSTGCGCSFACVGVGLFGGNEGEIGAICGVGAGVGARAVNG